ncbi:ABC transporter ATP-binding protein [Bowmanella pacifica]|nr:ATP-binding cassette domain-containing protein [Bowmanella pacifica]
MNKKATLIVEKLNKSYISRNEQVMAMDNIHLELTPSSFNILTGPSGAGKSSLLSSLGGLLPPDSGNVCFEGKNIWDLSAKQLCQHRLNNCSYIFQDANLHPCLTAIEQVIILLRKKGVSKQDAKLIAEQQLTEIGLGNKLNLLPNQLSGGEKQRVTIARAIASSAKLIFADEPTSSLDSKNTEHVVELLLNTALKHDAIIFCATHDERVLAHAHRILHMESGKIQSDTNTLEQDKL